MLTEEEYGNLFSQVRALFSMPGADQVTNGIVAPEQLIPAVDAVLEYNVNNNQAGLWESLLSYANGAAITDWGNDPAGRTLAEQPWSKIANWLRSFGEQRGYQLT